MGTSLQAGLFFISNGTGENVNRSIAKTGGRPLLQRRRDTPIWDELLEERLDRPGKSRLTNQSNFEIRTIPATKCAFRDAVATFSQTANDMGL